MAIINTRPTQSPGGFSLIEMAIVVLLMSIMLTMGMAALDAQQSSASFSATQKKEEIIKDALVAYLRANKRLPCPETTGLPGGESKPIGRENRTNGAPPDPASPCSSYVGTLPWLDLGLGKDIALDGYGNFFTYFVSSAAGASDPDWTRTATATPAVTGFSTGSPGRFAITNNGVNTGVDLSGNPLPALAVVVLVSHGKNGFGAITEKGTRLADSTDANELANQPPTAGASPPAWLPQVTAPVNYSALGMLAPAVTTTLVGSVSTGGTYDDIVLVIRPNDLLTPIIKDGAIKSSQAQLADNFARIKAALASYALATPNGTYNNGGCNAAVAVPPYCRLLPAATGGSMVPTTTLAAYGLTLSDGLDLWGSPIRYTPIVSTVSGAGVGLSNSLPAAGDAYKLTSDGPDKTQNTADDVSVTVSLVELRMMIGPTNLP